MGEPTPVHVIWSARTLDAHARTPDTYFKKYNRVHPERGGAEKAPDSYHFGSVKAARVLYTDVMNLHLERAGHTARLHPDRLRDRGFDRPPNPGWTPPIAAPSSSSTRSPRPCSRCWSTVAHAASMRVPSRLMPAPIGTSAGRLWRSTRRDAL